MRSWRPIYVNNSRIPVWLSYLAPIRIWAITLFPFVFCRGEMSESTKRHETIHFQQMLETLVLGFLLLYLWDYVHGLIKYRSGSVAYRRLRAEQEAYHMETVSQYCVGRQRYRWIWAYKV